MHSQHEEDKFVLLLCELHTEMACYKVLGHWVEGRGLGGLKPFGSWSLPLLELHTPSSRPRMSLGPGMLFRSHMCTVYSSQRMHMTCMLPPMFTVLQNVSTCGAMAKSWKSTIPLLSTQALNWNCLCWHLGIHYILVTLMCTKTHWLNYHLGSSVHYAPQMSVHVRDMCGLNNIHPGVAQEFSLGKFVVVKS